MIKHWICSKIARFIKDNLYYASTPHGFCICFGMVSIETTLIEIDFDRQGYTVPP